MVEARRLYEQIAKKLAQSIASGEYELGQRLPSERELAQTFAVSRPTVREAIIALELDGLVDVRLGSGVYVKNRQPPEGEEGVKDIGPFELLEARRSIEGEACALAAMRIDDAQLKELTDLIAEMREVESRLAEQQGETFAVIRESLKAGISALESAVEYILATYNDDIKAASMEVLTRHWATVTHHHAVGRDHRPGYDRQRPEPFAAALRAAKAALDPAGVLNPGVLVG